MPDTPATGPSLADDAFALGNGHARPAMGGAPAAPRAVPAATPAPTPAPPPGRTFVAQPTLVVGAGGIGHRIVLALKAALVEIHGHVPAGIRLLVFDIDDEHLAVPVGHRMVQLEPDSERFCLGPIPVARIRRNLDNLPTIAERLPCLRDLPPIATARAAKALRPLGSLAFQWQFPHIRSIVQRAIWAQAGRDAHGDAALAVDPGRGIKVVQVGSLCGGTNSGIFIELGRLLRAELEDLGTLGDACVSIGIGLLPGAFRGANSPNLGPNTAAALHEIEAVMLQPDAPAAYRNGAVIAPAQPPFDMYLLVDAVDEGGRVWNSRDDLCEMVARALMLLACTALGDEGDVELDNLDEVLAGRTADGHGRFFGSLGLGVLAFPAPAVASACADRHAHAVIAATLLRPETEADRAAARQWVERLGLDPDRLAGALAKDDNRAPLLVAPDVPPHIKQAPPADVPTLAAQYLSAWDRVQLETDARGWIALNGHAQAERLRLDVRAKVADIVDHPEGGAAVARGLLETLQTEVDGRQSALALWLGTARSDREGRRQDVAQHLDALQRAAAGPWLGRGARVQRALDGTFNAAADAARAAIDVWVAEQCQAILALVAEDIAGQRRQLHRLETRLAGEMTRAAQAWSEARDRLTTHTGHPALSLVDAPYLDQLYAAAAPEPAATLDRLRRALAPARIVADDGAGGVLACLQAACAGAFAGIAAMTVEQAMQDRADYSPRARLGALRQAALPAVNLDLTRLPGGDAALQRIDVVGVPHQATSILRAEAPHVVSLHDPHAILALSVTVGLPYTALQAWPAYAAAYGLARRARPLHTLPGFQSRGAEHRLALALGLAFGFIDTRGTWFYYRPADPLAEPHRLGQGAENAGQTLAREDARTAEILQRVEAHIDRIGTEQALAALDAWCAPAAGDDDLARDIKRQVRGYTDLLRQNDRLRAGG